MGQAGQVEESTVLEAAVPEPGDGEAFTQVPVVFVGQLPPPVHGQAVANLNLVSGRYRRLELDVVELDFSRSVDDVGALRVGKLVHLLRSAAALRRAAKAHGRHVLYYSVGLTGLAPAVRDTVLLLLGRRGAAATILHLHTGGAGRALAALPQPLRAAARRAYRGADAVVYLDERVAGPDDRLPEARRVYFLANAVADPLDGRRPPPRPPRAGRPGRILFLANLHESKGAGTLVEAVGLLAARGVEVEAVLAGGAPDANAAATLAAQAERAGVAERVRLAGAVHGEEKRVQFAEADVFCFPSRYEAEGMPLSVLEAMAFGLPVVACDWRAVPAVVEHGRPGLLTPPGDAAALADALERVLGDEGLAASLGDAARRRWEERYTLEHQQAEFERIVCEVSAVALRPGQGAAA
ncbi:MAG: glycosyltransferase family 4 protein [Acidimicrobiales bacterium]